MLRKSESYVRGLIWFPSLDLNNVFLPSSYSQGSQISLPHLHEHSVFMTLTAIRLFSGPAHLLIVRQGCAGAAQASRDKNCILYLNDLLVLSHSKEAARRDTMMVMNYRSSLGIAINWEELTAPQASASLLGSFPRLG